jgi:hypothetical protein
VWRKYKRAASPMVSRSVFHCEGIRESHGAAQLYLGTSILTFDPNGHMPVSEYCTGVFARALDPQGHFSRLDEEFSKLVECAFITSDSSNADEPEAIELACKLLNRLPATPPELLDSPLPPNDSESLLADYEVADGLSKTPKTPNASNKQWDKLQVVKCVSENIVGMALIIARGVGETPTPRNLRRLIDTIGQLLEEAAQLSAQAKTQQDKCGWFIVRAFLWTSWQRATMLLFWYVMVLSIFSYPRSAMYIALWRYIHESHLTNHVYLLLIFTRHILDIQLRSGYNFELNKELAIRGMHYSAQIRVQALRKEHAKSRTSNYLCRWAYELLKVDRASATQDFRRLHEHFSALFQDKVARCTDGQPCDGQSPTSCKRFKGAEVKDQSAHDVACLDPEKCKRLTWDEGSYRKVVGARAVCIDSTDTKLLRYREASNRTIAISHVWSHGQGGRPEKLMKNGQLGGMNSCLHRRYASISRDHFDCDSYWMDTPCIPEDHELRRESIAKINEIFANSKATLVCDRDLMEIDVSVLFGGIETSSAMRLRESLLATLLVCDWNLRAWTFLEAMRGRRNIQILCKGNAVISLKDLLQVVCQEGSIDLAILFLTSQHLLPPLVHGEKTGRQGKLKMMGFISLEEAGSLLSHRHASRDGDDIVIWSLLFGEKAFYTAKDMWKSRIALHQANLDLNTGFLISSVPRIAGHASLSWAPATPSYASSDSRKFYLAFDGQGTSQASISAMGLEASWYVHRFSGGADTRPPRQPPSREKDAIVLQFLRGYRFGALLQPIEMDRWGNTVPAKYRGNVSGPLLAVCGSNNETTSYWEWKGVYEWTNTDFLPDFKIETLLIA